MKLINNIAYLDITDAERCGLGKPEYIWKEKSRGAKWGTFIIDPDHGKRLLIEFDTLSLKHKQKALQCFGDPYEYLAKEPIRKMITKDHDAEKFFLAYRYDGDKTLPLKEGNNIIEKYTTAASWLNMLCKADENKKEIRQTLGIGIMDFWLKVCELIDGDKIDLPSSIRRLRDSVNNYQAKQKESKDAAYATLIHKQFGNDRAKKVKTDEAGAMLLEIISKQTQPDDVMTCYLYNKWASDNKHPQITPGTVCNYRRNNLADVITGRDGSAAFNRTFIKRVNGLLPSVPLALVEHDDNNLDFLFSDNKGYDFHKYVSICVIDSRTKLLLGCSYTLGRNPEQWQVYDAYLRAMHYIKNITGGWYEPFEVKADRWAGKTLTPFYKSIGNYVAPAHGNKQRGYIEQFFGSHHWKRAQKLISQGNWTGNNMTAKYRGVNEDMLRLNAKNRTMIGEEAELMIENFLLLLRHMPAITRENMSAPSKEQLFRQEWKQLKDEDKKEITHEQVFLKYGIKHNPERPITITNAGLTPQIDKVHYKYDLPEQWMLNKLPGEKVSIYYDPYDMSKVLATNEKDIRFIAKSSALQPRALKDQFPGSRTYLNAILAEKKEQVREVSAASTKRKEMVMVDRYYNPEAVLQAGILKKEIKNEAEHKMIEQQSASYEKFLNDNNDFDKYFEQ